MPLRLGKRQWPHEAMQSSESSDVGELTCQYRSAGKARGWRILYCIRLTSNAAGAVRIVADNPLAFAPSMALDAALAEYTVYFDRCPKHLSAAARQVRPMRAVLENTNRVFIKPLEAYQVELSGSSPPREDRRTGPSAQTGRRLQQSDYRTRPGTIAARRQRRRQYQWPAYRRS